MGYILIGLVLVFFDVSVNLGNMIVGFLPDCVGYALIWYGLKNWSGQSMYFENLKKVTVGLALYGVLLYAMDLTGISTSLSWGIVIFGLVSMIARVYVSRQLVRGLQEMEHAAGKYLETDLLESRWRLMTILQVVAVLCAFIPLVNVLGVIGNLATSIMFLQAFYQTGKAVGK